MKTIKGEELKDYLYKENVYINGVSSEFPITFKYDDNVSLMKDLINRVETKLGKSITNITLEDEQKMIDIILELKKNEQLYIIEHLLDLYALGCSKFLTPQSVELNPEYEFYTEVDPSFNIVCENILSDDRFLFSKEIILAVGDDSAESTDKTIEELERLEEKYNLELYGINH